MPNSEWMNGLGRGFRGGRGGRGGRMNGQGNGFCRRLEATAPGELTESLRVERDLLQQRLATVEAMLAEAGDKTSTPAS